MASQIGWYHKEKQEWRSYPADFTFNTNAPIGQFPSLEPFVFVESSFLAGRLVLFSLL